MKPSILCILTAAALFTGAAGHAIAAGDPAKGEVKAFSCLGCHGLPGYYNVYPSYRVPKLAGQHAAYIESALKAYRNGQRNHQTMQAQAAGLSDQDIADIAAYLETFPGN